MLNGFGTTVNGLGKRARPYLPQVREREGGRGEWKGGRGSAPV